MRTLMLITALALMSVIGLHAEETKETPETAEMTVEELHRILDEAICKTKSQMAEKVMLSRQKGVSMSAQMDLLVTSGNDYDEMNALIIEEAYKEPRWHSEEKQVRAAQELRDKVYLGCYQAMKKKYKD